MVHPKIALAILLIISVYSDIFEQNTRSLQAHSLNSDTGSFRYLIHHRNIKRIKDHNQKNLSYKLGQNQLISLTLEEFQAKYASYIKLPNETQPIVASLPRIGATASPTNKIIDWGAKGKVSPIKDQGSCGCCYAFSAIADVESSFLISKGKLYDFSEQEIVDCSTKYGNTGCSNTGGFYQYSFQYIINMGIHLQTNYPYTGSPTSQCKNLSKIISYSIRSYYGYKGVSCTVLMNLLATRPVIVSIDALNQKWWLYSSGILNDCGKSNYLNHGVQVIGVSTFSNGTSYYVVKNSWGTGWGENGKIRIDRNVKNGNLCLICSYPYYSII